MTTLNYFYGGSSGTLLERNPTDTKNTIAILTSRRERSIKSLGELRVSVHPGLKGSVIGMVLDSDAVGGQVERLAHAVVILARPTGEAPFTGNDQLLTAWGEEEGEGEREMGGRERERESGR